MQCQKVRLFGDAVFIKEPGSEAPTPWHRDWSYWSFDGERLYSVWIPLDEATEQNGVVRYVKGSHRWNRRFLPAEFRDGSASFKFGDEMGFEPVPA